MKRNIGVAAALCAALLLAGCAGGQLSQAEQAVPEGPEFSKQLYTGYVDLSRSEYNEGDYHDSDAFARRARIAARAGDVAPEAITARELPAEHVAELSNARSRLVAALDAGAATRDPVNAAKAQLMFDCWMQEQEENWQADDIAACRGGYLAAMDALTPAAAAAPAPVQPARYVVYFGSDKADLDSAAMAVIEEAKAAARKLGGATVKVVGNTDRDGDAEYNQMLSEMRAAAVAKMFATPDAPINAVVTEAHGERQPAVMTDDGVPKQANRRVDIIIEP